MVISRQVLVEADRNFSAKLPGLVNQLTNFGSLFGTLPL
jgi:hypothetical protein